MTGRAREGEPVSLGVLTGRAREGERGHIMVLTLGIVTVILVLALVIASVTALHIQRKQLLAIADAAALKAASHSAQYYRPTQDLRISSESVRAAVREYLDSYPAKLRGLKMGEGTGASEGGRADIHLIAQGHLPFTPWLAGLLPGIVRLEVRTSAQLQY